jgi:hypothetical protein
MGDNYVSLVQAPSGVVTISFGVNAPWGETTWFSTVYAPGGVVTISFGVQLPWGEKTSFFFYGLRTWKGDDQFFSLSSCTLKWDDSLLRSKHPDGRRSFLLRYPVSNFSRYDFYPHLPSAFIIITSHSHHKIRAFVFNYLLLRTRKDASYLSIRV